MEVLGCSVERQAPPRAHWRQLLITVTVIVDAIPLLGRSIVDGAGEGQWLPLPGPGVWDPSPHPIHHPDVSPLLLMGLPQMYDVPPFFFFFYLMLQV